MILIFPDTDTFRLALKGGFVPLDVALDKAAVAFGPDGQLSIESGGKLTRKASADLARLGVLVSKRHVGDTEPVSCWPQVLPATRDAAPPQLSSQAPVLFELESADDLPTLVGEMLRLGNDRQSLRWLADTDAPESRRVLLRVIGPPYYTLLRALDRTASGTAATVRAYVEQAPRVWVQLGYSHPSAAQVRMPDGQVLLLRAPRDWLFIPDGPFQEVYEVLDLRLPAAPVEWADTPVADKLTVPLRLVAGNAADASELWVLRGPAVDQLDAFVRDADERLTQRLKFAVARGPGGESVVVLRVTTSKHTPPVLPLAGAIGFKPYYKLPNLFLPAGTRLHPTLRRDAVRKLLADDPDRLVWLQPGEHGAFTPETLPEDAFRPLEDWVDYVIETNQMPLAAWVEATRFDFDHFICTDVPPKPKGPDDTSGKGRKKSGKADDETPTPTTEAGKGGLRKANDGDTESRPSSYVAAPVEVKPPSEWKLRRDELEKQFLDSGGALDAPERLRLWPELAIANAELRATDEAAVCWANAMWEPGADRGAINGWVRSELPDLLLPVTAAEFDKRAKPTDPTPSEARQLAALTLWVTSQEPVPAWFKSRLPFVQQYVEKFETKLPVRTVWLVASRLATLTGPDTLGLARVRDRLLNRLLEEGLKPERDLPAFLRYAGRKDSERVRQVREKATELHRDVRAWAEASLKNTAGPAATQSDQMATLGYVDLFFALGLAKLGEAEPARELVASARGVLQKFPTTEDRGIAAGFLLEAFRYRVEQALASKPHAGLLDPRLMDELDDYRRRSEDTAAKDSPYKLAYYAIARMREQCRILEPQEKLDPYHKYMAESDPFRKALHELPAIKDPGRLAKTIRDLYANGVQGKVSADVRFLVLVNALPLAARVGEAFTSELLALVPDAMRASAGPGSPLTGDLARNQGLLLERGLALAAHFDRRDVVQQLVDQFIDLIRAKTEVQRYELINAVGGQGLRSLRKLGLRDEIDKLLRRLQDLILAGGPPSQLVAKYATKPDMLGKALQSLLNLAAGWLTFGLTDQAEPILDDARATLLAPPKGLDSKDYTPLAAAYVAAVGQGSAESGLERIQELYGKMDPKRVTNSYTTSKFYSRFHLRLVEETVLAVVSDDFALGPAGRRWLDEDEYLVRRRIHADMRQHLATSGL